ncbi:NifB/NifX family molybdenum-iron cluster-binding protein [Varunaivibrio sulfuroxidans]|uniref:Nitrogen fixation protein NifX n=1 Tax=Varunaivibrio sulfuroxidans TaxID=1773489 RepID=A0A4V2UNE8_9PROT|nr:NifB/NifX family molybdenum-iron cluster-binding protein [Varunaivibrio sulfuroxidans]TCS61751.1 nitrogen fixation protein NifX [Varunaivibrio sulfuroxidans]WES32065.1 NifB/NifX family molybdenum-iron cluster-binding protein [Varunaivibrio sulfuroxidans]
MSVSCRFKVVSDRPDAHAASAVRVAFASSDMVHVDQHFGSAQSLAVYEIGPTFDRLIEVVRFAASDQDGNEDKLVSKFEALDGCAAVYAQAVGSSAIRQLVRLGVQPVKTPHGAAIGALIATLRADIQAGTPPWARAAGRADKDPSRFAAMAEETWDE